MQRFTKNLNGLIKTERQNHLYLPRGESIVTRVTDTGHLKRPLDDSTRPSNRIKDPELLRLYKAMDLAG